MNYRDKDLLRAIFCILFIGCGFFKSVSGASKIDRPQARIKESVVCCPMDTVIFDGWASIVSRGEIVRWIWDLNGDGEPDTSCTTGELKFRAPSSSKSFTVILKVKDNRGTISEPDSVTFHIMNSPPTVNIGGDTLIKAGTRLQLTPVVSSHCSKPIRYEWDFSDDGKMEYRSAENGNTSRIYYKPGRYQAKFKVTDEMGRETVRVKTITVQ